MATLMSGATALVIAAQRGYTPIVEQLLAKGADVSLVGGLGAARAALLVSLALTYVVSHGTTVMPPRSPAVLAVVAEQILQEAVGVQGRRARLQRLATWTDQDAEEFDAALAAQRVEHVPHLDALRMVIRQLPMQAAAVRAVDVGEYRQAGRTAGCIASCDFRRLKIFTQHAL